MSEYQKVEIRNEGEELTMHVEAVFFNPKSVTHKYPDFTFKGQSGGRAVMLYVPENACRRQFSRFKMEPEAAKGQVLRFWRGANVEDPTKPYWNIEPAAINAAHAPAPPKRMQGPSAVPGEAPSRYAEPLPPPPADDLGDLGQEPPEAIDYPVAGQSAPVVPEAASPREAAYFQLARRVARFQVALQKEYDIPCDMGSVNAMTFSIMGGIR